MKITRVEALYLCLPDVNARTDATQDTLILAFDPVLHTALG
jgi:hypothetical protein